MFLCFKEVCKSDRNLNIKSVSVFSRKPLGGKGAAYACDVD